MSGSGMLFGEDFKYGELLKFGEVNKNWGPILNPRSNFLHPLAHAFFENVCRMDSFVSLPAELAARVTREQIWKDCAILKITGKLEPDIRPVFDGHIQELIDVEVDKLRSGSRSEKVASRHRATIGVDYINQLLTSETGAMQSMESLLSLAIIDAWAAFEALAPDLWAAAVNHGPPDFAKRVNIAVDQGKPEPTFVKNWADKLQYDPRTHYAEALLEANRVSFKKLENIIKWYSVTFRNNVKNLFRNIDEGYIYALAAYRHVLVHNGGKVDKDFIRQIEPVDDLRGTFSENETLELDGGLVRRLRNAGTALGRELILFVDNLITPLATTQQ